MCIGGIWYEGIERYGEIVIVKRGHYGYARQHQIMNNVRIEMYGQVRAI